MNLLRFITAGSVDDGKSTLIGRLLYDTQNIHHDQLEVLRKKHQGNGHADVDLALLTDGLRDEREQGITIDVAYRYFSTENRKYILADAPGHIQYTRNMITGASHVDLIIILIDARNGITEQTRRHSIIASMLRIPHLIVAVNKMDLVDYSETVFNEIKQAYDAFARQLELKDITYVPVSALKGDNIVNKSERMPWYKENTLLQYLEQVKVEDDFDLDTPRFQVQYIIRPQSDELHDYRGYAGVISSGVFRTHDEVLVLPHHITTRIQSIEIAGKQVPEAYPQQSVTILTTDDIDISRGDWIVKKEAVPQIEKHASATICWLDDKPLRSGQKLLIQHGTKRVRAAVSAFHYKIDINNLSRTTPEGELKKNEIASVELRFATPLVFDRYKERKKTGAAILIDENTNNTVASVIFE
ncbi:MAG: GTP-binding protein [Chitinophagaceae bacterium]|nr:GTP-binding protein [Chitinophagaceae bacterium]